MIGIELFQPSLTLSIDEVDEVLGAESALFRRRNDQSRDVLSDPGLVLVLKVITDTLKNVVVVVEECFLWEPAVLC